MNRPSSFEDRLGAWLEEGPSTGPADLLATAHARARSVRQRPAWWLALKGETMETTWRARPLAMGRLGYALLILLLAVALAAAGLVFGSRLLPERGRNAALAVPSGPNQLLAFTSWSADGATRGDLYAVRADGTDERALVSDALDDWSPAWSPDGSAIAVYSSDDDSIQLRVVSAKGIRVLADSPGCFNPTSQPPAWSPDGRFIVYAVDRMPDDGICDDMFTDLYVVPADGSTPGRRLLASDHTEYSTSPAWSGDRIAYRSNRDGTGGLWVAQVTDPLAPWDLEATRIDRAPADPVGYSATHWSPDGTELATTYIGKNGPLGNAVVIASDGSSTRALWADPTVDSIGPAWSPDGSRLSLLVATETLADHAKYELAIVGPHGEAPRIVDTPSLSGNGGPAAFSPDGSRIVARAEAGDPMPGDLLILDIGSDPVSPPLVRVPARQWTTSSWQPLANPDDPVAGAPEGSPSL
jgi:Tol biopolymer transport system component